MKRFNPACALGALVALVAAGSARGEVIVYEFPLSPDQEVQNVTSPGNGDCVLTLDTVTGAYDIDCVFSDLVSDAVACHLHGYPPNGEQEATPGRNARIMKTLGFTMATAGTITGTGTLTQVQADHLVAGLCYINLHTVVYDGGEIRGQVVHLEDAWVVGADSIKTHGAHEMAIDLVEEFNNAPPPNILIGIEPRKGGPEKLAFTFNKDLDPLTALPANVEVNCEAHASPAISAVSVESGSTLVVELGGPMETVDCCRFTFPGIRTDGGGDARYFFDVVPLAGDMNFSGDVTGGDLSLVKPHFGEIAGIDLNQPWWDYDGNGVVTGSDFSLLKPLLGSGQPDDCP